MAAAPLDYQSRRPPEPPPGGPPEPHPGGPQRTYLMVGFIIGNLISAAVWLGGWGTVHVTLDDAIWSVIGVKALAGVLLIFLSKWHMAGLGLILSIATGALIFLGGCFMHFKI